MPGVKGVQYAGQVVRTDVETDLALVKLLVDAEFPTATLGNSNTIQVGDFVLAIGSPFGLEQTVTSGIVSDTDRTLRLARGAQGRRNQWLVGLHPRKRPDKHGHHAPQ